MLNQTPLRVTNAPLPILGSRNSSSITKRQPALTLAKEHARSLKKYDSELQKYIGYYGNEVWKSLKYDRGLLEHIKYDDSDLWKYIKEYDSKTSQCDTKKYSIKLDQQLENHFSLSSASVTSDYKKIKRIVKRR